MTNHPPLLPLTIQRDVFLWGVGGGGFGGGQSSGGESNLARFLGRSWGDSFVVSTLFALFLCFFVRSKNEQINILAGKSYELLFFFKEMTFGKVLQAFRSRLQGGKEDKELYLIDKKSGGRSNNNNEIFL